MRNLTILILVFLCKICCAQNTAAARMVNGEIYLLPQVHVFFNLGSDKLTNAARHTIDSMIYADALPPGRKIRIIGYADILGGEESNMELSRKRADAVMKYMRSMGIDSNQLESITARGETVRPEKQGGYPQDRKVIITLGDFIKPEKIVWTDSGTLIATIRFKYTTTIFYPYAVKMLDTVAEIMKKNPKMLISINGFVCCFNYDNLPIGTYTRLEGNRFKDTARLGGAERLSAARSGLIAKYLTNKGVAADRMKCHSFGYQKNKMLPDGRSEHGSDRVEIRAVKK